MKAFLDKIHRPGWKWNDIFLIPALISMLLLTIGQVLGALLIALLSGLLVNTPIASAASLLVK